MEQKPGAPIAAESNIFLQAQSTDAGLLGGDPPDCVEPNFQRQSTGLENGTCFDGVLESTRLATAKPGGQCPIFSSTTGLTLKTAAPTDFLKKTQALIVIGKDTIKFSQVLRVFQTRMSKSASRASQVHMLVKLISYFRL